MGNLDLGQLLKKIEDALKNLVTMEIITAVGGVKFKSSSNKGTEENLPDIDPNSNPKVILTKIDLLQGDIKTVFNEEFVTGNYQCLREFHADREKQGHEIVTKNIEAIKALIGIIKEFPEK